MAKQSLGLIETVGLTAAIEAADAAVKSANVNLVGYELAKGGGMVTVKLEGEIGAVNAAISAASHAAGNVGRVYAQKVIARPADHLEPLIRSPETVGISRAETGTVSETQRLEDSSPAVAEPEAQAPTIPVVNLDTGVDDTTSPCGDGFALSEAETTPLASKSKRANAPESATPEPPQKPGRQSGGKKSPRRD
ncbi:BMC domain-containing protein [Brenneria tiliae]|uniref:BMC domain-containing protein n=1 Tax=Brenneria tiliae TaxID=2914984 RepID=UPI0024B3AA8D|nr:BMC domain-containing protein [Brenneria tiliae]